MVLSCIVGTDAHDLSALVDVLGCCRRAVRLRSAARERTGARPEENAEVSTGSIFPDESVKVWRAFALMGCPDHLTTIIHRRWIEWVPRRGQPHLLPSIPPQSRADIKLAISDPRDVPRAIHGSH